MKRSMAWALLLALPAVLAIVADADAQQANLGGRYGWRGSKMSPASIRIGPPACR